MSTEESKVTQTTGEAAGQQEASSPPPEKKKSRSRPVKVYLTVLFFVALLLLVMSFFMQQRSHQALTDLNESLSSQESLMDLQMEKQKLELKTGKLEKERDEAQSKLDQKEKEAQALEWLRQIEDATRKSYSRARELVEQFHESGLEEALPDESVVEGGSSPKETYWSIYSYLF